MLSLFLHDCLNQKQNAPVIEKKVMMALDRGSEGQ